MNPLRVARSPRGAEVVGRRPVGSDGEDALDRATVAGLSSKEMLRMTRAELARVVRASPPPGRPVRPEYLDDGTLQRLAHLARLSCRNRSE